MVGPLYGLQSRNGYDMRPDTKLTPAQLRTFFTPWRYKPKRMTWDGLYISIQPVPVAAAAPIKAPSNPSSKPIPVPSATPNASPAILPSPPAASSPSPTASPGSIAVAGPLGTQSPTDPAKPTSSTSELLTAGVVALAILSGLTVWIVLAGGRSGPIRPWRRGSARR